MSEVDYWKARCRRAEGLLVKARQGIPSSRQRAAVLCALGELKASEWMGTDRLAAIANVDWSHLSKMEALGLVVSRSVEGANKCEWQLEHLVVPAADKE